MPLRPGDAGTDRVSVSEPQTKVDVRHEVKARTLYCTVKYWIRGGQFIRATDCGHHGYKTLEVVK